MSSFGLSWLRVFLLAHLLLSAPGAWAELSPVSQSELQAALAALEISDSGVTLVAAAHRKRSPSAEMPFTRQQAYEIGIDVIDVTTGERRLGALCHLSTC